jgi:hypothetical protein
MDAGGLRAINLCDLDVLQNQIAFLNRLYKMGITSYRYDQINGLAPYHMRLYNNSNITKTSTFLSQILLHCKKVRQYPQCDQIYANQIEDKITAILNQTNELKKYTSLGHNYSVGEVFTSDIDKNNMTKEKIAQNRTWWSLIGELEAMNVGLDNKDKIGVFDFGLRDVIKSAVVPTDKNLTIDNTKWKDLMKLSVIGYDNQKYTRSYPCLAYTFLDNHDTDYMLGLYAQTYEERGAPSGISYDRLIVGYFVTLMMPGYPVVYKFHYSWFKPISVFIMLRQILGVRYDSILQIPPTNGQNYIIWKITSANGTVYTFVVLDTTKNVALNLNDNNIIFKYPLPKTEKIEMRIYSETGFSPISPGMTNTPYSPTITPYTGPTAPPPPVYPSLRPPVTQYCTDKKYPTPPLIIPQCTQPVIIPQCPQPNNTCNSNVGIYQLQSNLY